jgi:hypothetical protein
MEFSFFNSTIDTVSVVDPLTQSFRVRTSMILACREMTTLSFFKIPKTLF